MLRYRWLFHDRKQHQTKMDLDELKKKLQAHFSDNLVIVVGSGLSCAEGLPGMGQLAEHLIDRLPPQLSGTDAHQWKSIEEHLKAGMGLEAALQKTPPNTTIEAGIVAHTAQLMEEAEVHVAKSVLFGGQRLRFASLLEHMLKSPDGIPVVTTNYDRLIELSAEVAGLAIDTMFAGNYLARLDPKSSRYSHCRGVTPNTKGRQQRLRYAAHIRLYKPHGSLEWYSCNDEPVRFAFSIAAPRLIVPPGLNKYRSGYSRPFDTHRDKANGAIDRAARFLVLGYGFNDDHLETHLTARIRSGVPTLVLTHTLSDNAAQVVNSATDVICFTHGKQGGFTGTNAIMNGNKQFFPDLNLWDLGEFIEEVF